MALYSRGICYREEKEQGVEHDRQHNLEEEEEEQDKNKNKNI